MGRFGEESGLDAEAHHVDAGRIVPPSLRRQRLLGSTFVQHAFRSIRYYRSKVPRQLMEGQ
jgi:hypothetical protein